MRFLQVAGGGADVAEVVGKVRTLAAIETSGGEAFMGSVILGDAAYDVQQGFVGEPLTASAKDGAS